MLKTIIIKELQNHLYSLRFIFALALTLFLFSISSISFVIDFREQKHTHEAGLAKIQENMKNVTDNASRLAQNMNVYPFAPRNSSFIASCEEEAMPNTIVYTAFNVYGFDVAKGSKNPFILPSKSVNWEFIIMILFSFLAIIFTFDALSGEKEMRTLALALSNPVSRGVLLTGKFLGSVIVLSLLVFVGVFLSMIILLLSGQVAITSFTLLEIGGFLFMSFLMIACAATIGLFTSVISFNPNTSLFIGLMIWLIFMFVIPHTALLLSNRLFPVESSDVIAANTQNAINAIEASYPDGKWSSSSNMPFMPKHKIRANMQMDFMLSEKKIKDNWYDSQFSQFQNTCKLSLVSPMFVFQMGDEYILNGGFQRFKKNWNDLHTYQSQFFDWFKSFDANDEKSPHWFNPYEDYSTSKLKVNIDEIPVLTERTVTFTNRLVDGGLYIALLLIYTAIVFFVSFVLLIRYDVR
jgi:ABC-type transport system involved in multi-copper enzyme maturation permease subunit